MKSIADKSKELEALVSQHAGPAASDDLSAAQKRLAADREASNRKIALEVLQRRNPSANRSIYALPTSTSSQYRGVSEPRNQRAHNYGGMRHAVTRLPLGDGSILAGASPEAIGWRPSAGRMRPPLGSASGALPWWNHENASNSFNYGMARPGLVAPSASHAYVERTLAGRYHQLFLKNQRRQQPSRPPSAEYGFAYAVPASPTHSDRRRYEEIDPSAVADPGGLPPTPRESPTPPAAAPPQPPSALPEAPPPPPAAPRVLDDLDDWEAEEAEEDEEYDGAEEDDVPLPPTRGHPQTTRATPGPPPPTPPPEHALRRNHPAAPSLPPRIPTQLAKFRAALDCTERDNPYHIDKRALLWEDFDANGNGYISLAECNGGVLRVLCKMWGREGDGLFRRYYRSYIRAWADAKDAVAAIEPRDDDYVTRAEFRLLLVYLSLYATWFEVFRYIIDEDKDHRLSRDEWVAKLPQMVEAGQTWADSIALASATAASFDEMDQNDGGMIDLQEFCEWVEAAEKRAGTAQGLELGVNEPIDRPSYGSHRIWHTTPLEMRGDGTRTKRVRVPFSDELPEGADLTSLIVERRGAHNT